MRCRIELTDEDMEMLALIGQVLNVSKRRPQFGNTLAAFFRLVMQYAADNPDTELAHDLRKRIEAAKRQKRRYRRRNPVLAGLKEEREERRDARRSKIVAEDYTVEEAHGTALHMEGTKILKEVERGTKATKKQRRKRSRV